MSRRVTRRLTAALAVVAAGASGLVGAGGAGARPARTFPARLLVYAQEYTLQPSRAVLPAGPVVVQLWNRGQDPHDLRVQRMTAAGAMVGAVQGVPTTLPGRVRSARWTLRPGRYMLFCSLPGHMAAGMHVTIRIRRR
jgi:uncharacterized cupredoxin-like copper-binding protein